MPDRIFRIIFIIGWAVYMFGIYTPNMRRYRKQQVNITHSRPLDIALDMLAFLGWQVIPLVFAFSPRLTFGNFELPEWCGWAGTFLFDLLHLALWPGLRRPGKKLVPQDRHYRKTKAGHGRRVHSYSPPGVCRHVGVGHCPAPADGKLDRRVFSGGLLSAPVSDPRTARRKDAVGKFR